jgi:hypothetical protein
MKRRARLLPRAAPVRVSKERPASLEGQSGEWRVPASVRGGYAVDPAVAAYVAHDPREEPPGRSELASGVIVAAPFAADAVAPEPHAGAPGRAFEGEPVRTGGDLGAHGAAAGHQRELRALRMARARRQTRSLAESAPVRFR